MEKGLQPNNLFDIIKNIMLQMEDKNGKVFTEKDVAEIIPFQYSGYNQKINKEITNKQIYLVDAIATGVIQYILNAIKNAPTKTDEGKDSIANFVAGVVAGLK
jgi:hypothetical protein